MTEKMTNKKALMYAIDNLSDAPDEVIQKLLKMIEQLDKKNASPKKMTAQQEKNEGLKSVIAEFLSENEGKGFTVSDLLKAIPEFEGDSNQHVSALMRQLVQSGTVEKYSEKRRTYFSIVAEG
jgi:DNA-binding transcriptional regulator GbsR (MarR family)